MDMDLITVDLKLAFQQPGCPLCRLRSRSAARYIHTLLWENVNDGETRMHIVRGLGFCPTHAWQLQQMEALAWGDGLGTAIIYEDLTTRAIAGLDAYLREQEGKVARLQAQPSRWRRWLTWASQRWRRWLGLLTGSPTEYLPTGLVPYAPCRVCQISAGSEMAYLRWLVRGCAQPEFRDWYGASDGLCLGHLRQALALAEQEQPEAALFLGRTARTRLNRLVRGLHGYIRKHAWELRHEPKLPEEQSSWIRAVAFFAGERPEVMERERSASRSI